MIPELVFVLVTAYCDIGIMYNGEITRPGVAACPPGYDGMRFVFPYTDAGWTCTDRGEMVREGHIDIWLQPCSAAWLWGRKWMLLEVKEIENDILHPTQIRHRQCPR